MKTLRDRVVVLTGAAGGIGRALAVRLIAEGASVALVDCDAAGLARVAAGLDAGDRITTWQVDLRDRSAIATLASDVVARHGSVHVLINNAGVTVHARFVDASPQAFDRVFDVNLLAPVETIRAFLPHLRAFAPAQIVNVSSMAGFCGFPYQTAYSASKFGLRGLGQALRPELASLGIGVSTVMPGTIATEFLARADGPNTPSRGRLSDLMLRYGTSPDRVARATVRAIVNDRGEVRVGWDCHLMALARWACPPAVPWILHLAYRRAALGPVD